MATAYSQLTSLQKQEIIDAFSSGMECRYISTALNFSGRAVPRVLAEAGINTKRRNRYVLNENYFDVIDSQVKAYLLGLLAADGCVTTKDYVTFESIDQELTHLLKQELEYSGSTRVIKPQNYAPHYRINFSSRQLATALRKLGVVAGRGSSGIYYFPDSNYLAAYVLGYFDGDGCAYVNPNRSGGSICIVGSYEFTSELAKLLGMGAVKEHQSKSVYYWTIYSRDNINKFYQLIYQYPGLGLQRKKYKIQQILGSYKRG
jgi:hypothetical protein